VRNSVDGPHLRALPVQSDRAWGRGWRPLVLLRTLRTAHYIGRRERSRRLEQFHRHYKRHKLLVILTLSVAECGRIPVFCFCSCFCRCLSSAYLDSEFALTLTSHDTGCPIFAALLRLRWVFARGANRLFSQSENSVEGWFSTIFPAKNACQVPKPPNSMKTSQIEFAYSFRPIRYN